MIFHSLWLTRKTMWIGWLESLIVFYKYLILSWTEWKKWPIGTQFLTSNRVGWMEMGYKRGAFTVNGATFGLNLEV